MKELMCAWQETILELGLNIQVSRCVNPTSDFYFDLVHKERCKNCRQRKVITSTDPLTASLKDDVYVKLDTRSDEVVERLLSLHCKDCDHFNKKDGLCAKTKCEYPIPIRDLMRNTDTHCELERW